MKPLHPNVTRAAVVASLAAAATTLYALASPLHSLFGYETKSIEAISAIISAVGVLIVGAGQSVLEQPGVSVPTNPTPPVQPEKAVRP
jgi:hypothetical protein